MNKKAIAILGAIFLLSQAGALADTVTLLNVSYDPTRELYRDINEQFVSAYEKQTGLRAALAFLHDVSQIRPMKAGNVLCRTA